jgi:TRAP-type mannitol/chloroaromatic compound transport system substrate-binding protein
MKARLSVFAAVAAVSMALVAPGSAVAAGPRVLRIQASWPESLTLYEDLTDWARRVETLSGGSLRIETLPDGQIVPAPEAIDAAHRKVIDGAHSWTGYLRGRDMTALLFTGGPGGTHGMDFIDYVGWLHEGGGRELYREFFRDVLKLDVIPIPMLPAGPQAFGWFKKPFRNFADLKKLKCRQTGIAADVWRELGLTVVEMPGGEIVAAGQSDAIDCAEWFGGVEDLRLGLQNVWKYLYAPSVHESVAVGGLFMNGEVWQSLSPQQRAIIRSAANETFLIWWVKWQKENADALKELRERYGVQLMRTPPDVLEQFLTTWDKMAEREAERNPFFRKVWESQKNYAELVVPAKRFYFPPYDQTADHYWPEDGRDARKRK